MFRTQSSLHRKWFVLFVQFCVISLLAVFAFRTTLVKTIAQEVLPTTDRPLDGQAIVMPSEFAEDGGNDTNVQSYLLAEDLLSLCPAYGSVPMEEISPSCHHLYARMAREDNIPPPPSLVEGKQWQDAQAQDGPPPTDQPLDGQSAATSSEVAVAGMEDVYGPPYVLTEDLLARCPPYEQIPAEDVPTFCQPLYARLMGGDRISPLSPVAEAQQRQDAQPLPGNMDEMVPPTPEPGGSEEGGPEPVEPTPEPAICTSEDMMAIVDGAVSQTCRLLPVAPGYHVLQTDQPRSQERMAPTLVLGTGLISGTVTGMGASPLSNVNVTLYAYSGSSWNPYSGMSTGSAGGYAFEGLPAGTYRISFEDYTGNYLSEFYNDVDNFDDATDIVVGEGDTVSNVDAVLAVGSHITGKVTTEGGAALSGIRVTAYRYQNGSWQYYRSASTSITGTYDIGGLPAGTYRVGFNPNQYNYYHSDRSYQGEYYNDKADLNSADDIVVTAESTVSSIDAELALGGQIRGRVTDANGNGLASIWVNIFKHSGSSWQAFSTAITSITGTYSIDGLAAGIYRLGFQDVQQNIYLSEYYNDKANIDSADDIAVTVGNTVSNVDAMLAAGSHITGKVTDADGAALSGINVTAYRNQNGSWQSYRSASTSITGTYDIGGLPADTYRVYFEPYNYYYRYSPYLAEYYNDKSELNSANDIVVAAGSMVSNIDAKLALGGQISGKVKAANGDNLGDILVTLYRYYSYSPTYGFWQDIGFTSTSITGTYSFIGLPANIYRVGFQDNQQAYIAEFYNDKKDLNNADDIAVTVGNTVSNVDAVLAVGSHITGKVTAEGGAPLSGVGVTVYRNQNGSWQSYRSTSTTISGTYDIGGLPADTYRVYFNPDYRSPYLGEYYNDKADIDSADNIVVAAGSTVSNINAVLALGGQISGKVTGQSGVPSRAIGVVAYRYEDGSWQSYRSVAVNISSTYDISGLPAGTYRIQFSPYNYSDYTSPYLAEYYNDKADLDSADDIAVVAGSTVGNVNAVLALGGQISGKVTSANGSNLSGISVTLYRNSGSSWQWVSSTNTSITGTYSFVGLAGATYRVGFQDNQQNTYIAEYYNDKTDLGSADDIAVIVGNTVSNVDAVLAVGSHIAGKVTGVDGAALSGINVTAYRNQNGSWQYYRSTSTTITGTYDIGSLPVDTYRVYFNPSSYYGYSPYLGEYYNDKADIDSADNVVVAAESTVGNINAVLALGGQIEGKVTSAKGDNLAGISVTLYRYHSYSPTSGNWQSIRSTGTSISGTYSFVGLAGDNYRVGFQDNQQNTYIAEYYNDKVDFNNADDIAVTVGNIVSNVDAELAVGSHITGKVMAEGGTDIAGVYVTAYRNQNGSWQSYRSASTSITGTYDIGGLPADTYRVYFSPYNYYTPSPYLSEYYNDKADIDSADNVVVAGESTVSNINAALTLGAQIRGKVTAEDATVLPGISAVAYYKSATGSSWQSYRSTTTSVSGTYELNGLPSGVYVVGLSDPQQVYVSEYYDDAEYIDTATPISMTAPVIRSDVNAVLERSGSISGTVMGSGNALLSGIEVSVYKYASGRWVNTGYAYSDAQGRYAVRGLAPGKYRLYFVDNGSRTYAPEYYNNVTDLNSGPDAANDVTVTAGNVTANIDASLAIGGRISGQVTVPSGSDPSSVYVYAARLTGSSWQWGSSVPVSSTGVYEMSGLPTGVYIVYFGSYTSPGYYYGERYYGDVVDGNKAKPVVVNVGQTTSGININMTPVTGAVQGTISPMSPSSSSFYVTIYDHRYNYWSSQRSVSVSASGQYTLPLLDTGIYRIAARDNSGNYAPKYYASASELDGATNIDVTNGVTVTGIDLMLEPAGVLTGTLRNSTGQPLGTGYVYATRYNETNNYWETVRSTQTRPDGLFILGGLPAGLYQVRAEDWTGAYASTYYGNMPSSQNSPFITVTQGITIPNIDLLLGDAGRIFGRVTTDGGMSISGIYVYASRMEGGVGRSATTDRSGAYEIEGLSAGNYRVEFYDGQNQYPDEYYNDSFSWDGASEVTVAAGATVSDINAVLSRQNTGSIAGKVTTGDTTPLPGVQVIAYRHTGNYWSSIGSAYTAIDGSYRLNTLPPGDYALQFREPTGVYALEYYNDAVTLAQATVIPVSAGGTVNNATTMLAQAAIIQGNVSQAAREGVNTPLVEVVAYRIDGNSWQWMNSTYSGPGGAFVLNGLPSGTYRLRFQDVSRRFATTYSGNSATLGGATDVAANAGQTTTANESLNLGGQIAGLVKNSAGKPLEQVTINAYRQDGNGWSWIASDRSGPDGTYGVSGLPAGIYRVEFRDWSGTHVSKFYGDSSQIEGATDVTVSSGGTVPDIDATLVPSSQAAIANFAGTPTSGTAPLTVQFTDSSTGGINSWNWSFGDGGTSTAQNPSHTYTAAGSYTVTLSVAGAGGSNSKTLAGYITVGQGNVYLPVIVR